MAPVSPREPPRPVAPVAPVSPVGPVAPVAPVRPELFKNVKHDPLDIVYLNQCQFRCFVIELVVF